MIDPRILMPRPNVMLVVDAVDGPDGDRCGGAAMLGPDGRWYWTMDRKMDSAIPFRITGWTYMDADPEPEPDPGTGRLCPHACPGGGCDLRSGAAGDPACTGTEAEMIKCAYADDPPPPDQAPARFSHEDVARAMKRLGLSGARGMIRALDILRRFARPNYDADDIIDLYENDPGY